jgi:3-hydroxyacyl-[acyl-carrier-protein] dehydratase
MDSIGIHSEGVALSTVDIMRLIPHRYPMLMIDRMINVVGDERGTGIKNLTINEHFFSGHFPRHPVMPGVLVIEAMAQVSAVLVMHSLGLLPENRLVYFMTIDSARFRKPLFPGDTVYIKVTKQKQRGKVWKYKGEAVSNGVLCAESTYSAMLADE